MLSSILLLDADGIHLRHGAARTLPAGYVRALDGAPIGERAGSCGTAAYLRRPVIVEDIATDPLWSDYKELGLAFGLHACWSTPILDVQGGVLGTFAMHFREPRRPQQLHQRLIQLSTSLAALAIARHREETALRKANRELRLLSGVSQALVRSIDEKELIARFCHVVVDNAPYRFAAVVAWDESMPDKVRLVTRTGDGSPEDENLLSDLAAIGAVPFEPDRSFGTAPERQPVWRSRCRPGSRSGGASSAPGMSTRSTRARSRSWPSSQAIWPSACTRSERDGAPCGSGRADPERGTLPRDFRAGRRGSRPRRADGHFIRVNHSQRSPATPAKSCRS